MPGKQSDYSILLYAGLISIFIMLAMIGSYAIIFMSGDRSPNGIYDMGGGYGFSCYDDQMQPAGSYLQDARNGSFSGTLHLETFGETSYDDSWLIMTLVDYRLMPVYYNGSLEKSHVINFRSPAAFNISFNVTGLEDGSHDLMFINVRDPDCKRLEGQGNDRTTVTAENGMRYKVTEGNETGPIPQFNAGPLEKYVAYLNNSKDNFLSYGPWLSEKPFLDMYSPITMVPSGNAIYYIEAAPGEDIGYYINIRNGFGSANEAYSRFAIMQLLDYEQMPLNQNTSEDVYFGALDPGRTLAIQAGIKAPETPGTHVLSIVTATWPYEEADYDAGKFPQAGIKQIIINVIV